MEDIMNRLSVTALAVLAFILLLGIVGRYDYATEVVQSIPDVAYHTIVERLGDDCSDIDIAEEYEANKQYYDTLKY